MVVLSRANRLVLQDNVGSLRRLIKMIEDIEIASRFLRSQVNQHSELAIAGTNTASTLAGIVSQTLPNIKLLPQTDRQVLRWSELVDQAISAISEHQPAVVFLLWGGPARKRAALVNREKHLVIEAGHPSPLNRLNDFRGTHPFSRARRAANTTIWNAR